MAQRSRVNEFNSAEQNEGSIGFKETEHLVINGESRMFPMPKVLTSNKVFIAFEPKYVRNKCFPETKSFCFFLFARVDFSPSHPQSFLRRRGPSEQARNIFYVAQVFTFPLIIERENENHGKHSVLLEIYAKTPKFF